MSLTLDSPIELLKLSNRVRNVLHLSGLHTVGNVLECDFTTGLRGFGPAARAELASVLKSHGLAPPAPLARSELDNFNEDVSKLFVQMEASFRKWNVRVEHFEARVRELTTKGRSFDLNSPPAGGEQPPSAAAVAGQAEEFKARLTALRIARIVLRGLTRFPEHQAVAGLEQERLSHLIGRLLAMLPQRNACSLPKQRNPPDPIRTGTPSPLA
jgi:hypothetical protein